MQKGSLTVYKASAGSGKTFTLTAEYVALLLSGEPSTHRAILAVTFTNKATAEMKSRILQELWEIAYGQTGTQSSFAKAVMSHLKNTSPEQLRTRAASALHAIVHDYDHFYVETIDTFFQSLLTALSHELGLSAGFKVEIDDMRVVEMAVDRLMADISHHPQVLKWVLDYVRDRIKEEENWDATREIKSLAHHITREHFLLHEEEVLRFLAKPKALSDCIERLYALKKTACSRLVEAAMQFNESVMQAGGYSLFNNGGNVETFVGKLMNGELPDVSPAMAERSGNPNKWLRKPDLKKPELVNIAAHTADNFARLLQTFAEEEIIIRSCQLTLQFVHPLRLIGEIGHEATIINEEAQRFMLAKTPLLFDRLVGQEDASFVFERAGTQFHHIMIDEFQDTSALQWRNFQRLLVENMAQDNSCLLVGDVKQAIYRFRGGDWKILNDIENAFANRPISVRHLDTNFRSDRAVIAFNNALFPKAAAVIDDCAHEAAAADRHIVANTYADVEQRDAGHAGGHVEVCFLPPKKQRKKKMPEVEEATTSDEDEINVVCLLAQKIIELHDKNGVAYKDMAILVRRNADATAILEQLSESGYGYLPVVSDEAFILRASPHIQLLVHALRWIDDETDTAARAYVARAIVGEENVAWATAELPTDLTESRETLRRKPLYELVEFLIARFGMDKDAEAAPFLCYFLDEVMNFIEDGQSTIAEFLNFWNDSLYKKSIPAGDVAGIRILTIHKAKGLAFHTVLMPACDWDLEKDRPRDLLWCTPQVAPFNAIPIVPITPKDTMARSIYASEYNAEHRDQRTENLNIMYVAFTRARHNLYIWARPHTKDKKGAKPKAMNMGDVLREAIDAFASVSPVGGDGENASSLYVFEDTNVATVEKKVGKTSQPSHNPLLKTAETETQTFSTFAPHVVFRQSSAARDFVADAQGATDEDNRHYIDRGKLLHRVFSSIRTLTDLDNALATLKQGGVIGSDAEAASLRRLVVQRVSAPAVRAWFDGSWQVHNECNILSRTADGQLQVRRPDRVMTRGDKAIVVDFKFGKARSEYRDQVTAYCRLLTQMGYAHVSGYLWYVYEGEIDPVVVPA